MKEPLALNCQISYSIGITCGLHYVAACYIDIALVIDCSGSIRKANEPGEDNWEHIINFAINLVERINVGDDETHVAAVSFGIQILLLFLLLQLPQS